MSLLSNLFNQNTLGKTVDPIQLVPFDRLEVHQKFEVLESYYKSNGLYQKEDLAAKYTGLWREAIKPIRNCVNRSVEYYAAKICSDSPVVIASSDIVRESVDRFLKWSNFDKQRRVALRHLALYGNCFQKMVITEKSVYFELVEPEYVTDFEEDSRGNVISFRIDIPTEEDDKPMTYTEYWTAADGYMATWMHPGDKTTPLDQMPTSPSNYIELSQWGITFLPIIHTKFKDLGDKWGEGCVNHAISKIDEANRQATRIGQLMFRYNKPFMAVMANSETSDGRPLPAPVVGMTNNGIGANNTSDITSTDNDLISLPGKSSIESLIPQINYDSAIKFLEGMETELEKDMPELRYYSLKEGQLSGKAISFLLAGALDRATEAQNAFVAGQERLCEMALTLGKFAQLFPATIGTYENGDFAVKLMFQSVMPKMDETESSAILKSLVDSGVPLLVAMQMAGYSQEIVDRVAAGTVVPPVA